MGKFQKNYLLEKIVEILTREHRGRVLDLGCGDGEYASRLKEAGFNVVAADLDEKRFRYGNEIEFKRCDVTKPLPFQDAKFDYVLFLEVIEHLRDTSSLMRSSIMKAVCPSLACHT